MTEPTVITVVSGLPRSGTSMMMQMLAAGGVEILTDNLRLPDANNPQGYFEYEPVKRLALDSTWLPQAHGKAVKIVAPLLPCLPLQLPNTYRVIFMHRPWEDVSASQSRMLRTLGLAHLQQPEPELRRGMQHHQTAALAWLAQNAIPVLEIDYCRTLEAPERTAARLAAWIPSFQPQPAALAVLRRASS